MQLKLKAMREARHMSQSELANAVGTTLRKVSSWETLETPIKLADAARIADFFGCTLDELAGRDYRPGNGYADSRQAELNRCWAEADDSNRETILSVARLSTGRGTADPADADAEQGAVRAGVTEVA